MQRYYNKKNKKNRPYSGILKKRKTQWRRHVMGNMPSTATLPHIYASHGHSVRLSSSNLA